MLGTRFVERNAQKLPQRQAVGAPPGDPPLTVDPFEVPHQQHAEIDARRDRALPASLDLLVERLAPLLDPAVEAGFGEQHVEGLVEGMPLRARELLRRDKQRLLPRFLPPSHRHREPSVTAAPDRPREDNKPRSIVAASGGILQHAAKARRSATGSPPLILSGSRPSSFRTPTPQPKNSAVTSRSLSTPAAMFSERRLNVTLRGITIQRGGNKPRSAQPRDRQPWRPGSRPSVDASANKCGGLLGRQR